MPEYLDIDLPDPVDIAIPIFVITVLLEMFLAKRTGKVNYEAKDTAASLSMGLGNQVMALLLGGLTFAASLWAYKYRLFDLGTGPLVFVLAFFLEDLTYYWAHRLGHERRYFWASHIVHHSSQHYNLSTALRQTWTGNLAGGFIFWMPMAFIGIHPAIIAFFGGLSLVYQYWIHTEAIDKMPKWFEAVMNTPSHHRVHHATNPEYLDRNYAGVLIIWDKIFGTFVEENPENKPKYGIVTNLATFNPFRIAYHEWFSIFKDLETAKNPREALGYVFGPPGWTPDGSRKTTAVIKAEWAELNQSNAK